MVMVDASDAAPITRPAFAALSLHVSQVFGIF